MQAVKKTADKKKTYAFIFLFIAGLLGGVIIAYIIESYKQPTQVTLNDNALRLIQQTDNFQTGFAKLEQLNKKYASVLSDNNFDTTKILLLDSLNAAIANTQFLFSNKLDSIEKKNEGYDKNSFVLLNRIADGYRAAVEQSKSLNIIRNAFTIIDTGFSLDKSMFIKMQDELREKEIQIAAINNLLQANETANGKNFPLDYKGMIKTQDSILNVVLVSQKKRNENLVSYNNKLKLDNDRLKNQVAEIQNANVENKIAASTTVSTQELEERVNLAKVDCFLTRADIKQTISNDKQRKELLENALQILNKLSQTGNISVKKEAQKKLEELKVIAANNHD